MNHTARRFLKGRVARRVFLLFVLSAFVPLATMAVLSLTQVRELLLQQGDQRLAATAKAQGMALFERLLLATDAAATVGRAGRLSGGESFANQNFLSLGLVDGEGRLRTVLGTPGLPALSPENRERLAQGKPVAFTETREGRPRVMIAVAPPGLAPGSFVFGEPVPEYLWGLPEQMPAATEFCVIEEDTRRILECPGTMAEMVFQAVDARPTQTTLKSIQSEQYGERWRAVVWGQFMRAGFGTSDWLVVARQPESHVLAPVAEFRRLYLPVVALAVLVVIWLTVRQVRSVLGPVEQLADRARGVAQNDFSSRVKVERDDEFGELATAFNQMSSKLGRQFAALTALSEIDRLILSTPKTEQVIGTVLERIGESVPADCFSLTLFDHDNPEHARTYFRETDPKDGMSIVRHEIPASDRVRLEAEPLGAWKPLADPAPTWLAHQREQGAHTVFVQPIVWREAVCGVLALGYRAASTLSDEEMKQARDFADRVAVAVSSVWRDEQLYNQAHFDPVTGLPNRLLFKDRLAREIVRCQREEGRFALLFIDLDHFKNVNDTFGHTSGDAVLRESARRISACVREADTVSRLGGDEFTVMLTHVQRPHDAVRVANEIVQALSREFDVGDQRSFLSASVGIAFYPNDGRSAEELLKNADTAMYKAKAGGRAQAVYFEERMNAETVARFTLDRDLRLAIENGELQLHYQPRSDLRTGRIYGAEALLRWRHPKQGWVPPARFIPIAEESGFIEPLGQWILREACVQMKAWKDAGLPLERLSVNVSPRQFRGREPVDYLARCLNETGVRGSWLEIEITEGLLVSHAQSVEGLLAEIDKMGVSIALDDFGTGFSSMAYLKRFPVDTIKIDRVFVEGLEASADSRAIVAAIIAMSHALGKSVVAEGVETPAQVALLRELKCDELQGYHISSALDAASFARFVRDIEARVPA